MRGTELLRLVWLNINQNKFKSIMTSIGIVVGAATIVLVIGIGRGGQMDIAEQFTNLNAGAIDVSYEWAGEETGGGMPGGTMSPPGESSFGSFGERPQGDGRNNGGAMPEDRGNSEGAMPEAGEMPEGAEAGQIRENTRDMEGESEEETETGSIIEERLNQENIQLTQEDAEDIQQFVQGITGVAISYNTRSSVEGGDLTAAQTYTIGGVKENFQSVGGLMVGEGTFLTDEDDEGKTRVCVLGATVAKEIFSSTEEACGSTIYIDDRGYTVSGVLESNGMVSAGMSPDTTIFIPYQTGIKYITGENVSPVITVIAEDINNLDTVIASAKSVLENNYINAEFTFSDAGSKMEAAESSNEILTLLLGAMATIVFLVGGIGIMNVLFVSVKERTGEIGILKSLGASRTNIMFEFLAESAAISLIGGILGVAISFLVVPVVEYNSVRVEINGFAWMAALGFAVLTGTLFGIYPAWKASRLQPVEALNAE